MTKQVDRREIEKIVGAKRHPTEHVGRFVVAEQTVYILHSQECLERDIDLRTCEFSIALDQTDGGLFPILFPHNRAFLLGIAKDPLQLMWKVCGVPNCWKDGYVSIEGTGRLGFKFQSHLCEEHTPKLELNSKKVGEGL